MTLEHEKASFYTILQRNFNEVYSLRQPASPQKLSLQQLVLAAWQGALRDIQFL